jgi:hypothetical protein
VAIFVHCGIGHSPFCSLSYAGAQSNTQQLAYVHLLRVATLSVVQLYFLQFLELIVTVMFELFLTPISKECQCHPSKH